MPMEIVYIGPCQGSYAVMRTDVELCMRTFIELCKNKDKYLNDCYLKELTGLDDCGELTRE